MEGLILSYCYIRSNSIFANGYPVFEAGQESELPEFLGAAYKKLALNYPKFHKMDKLCKLGLLATEICLRDCGEWSADEAKNTALVFTNQSASLDTDRLHATAISNKENYFPSPSVFVYTLPNIVLGEIAIKHKICGENAFFISPHIDPVLLHTYTTILLQRANTSFVICAWIDVDAARHEAFVYCVKKSNFKGDKKPPEMAHTAENIRKLYTR